MCFILTVLFVIATYVFATKGLTIQAIGSGAIAALSMFFFIRKLIKNAPCIFKGEREC